MLPLELGQPIWVGMVVGADELVVGTEEAVALKDTMGVPEAEELPFVGTLVGRPDTEELPLAEIGVENPDSDELLFDPIEVGSPDITEVEPVPIIEEL